MALIGYARVSTEEQHLDLQRDALKAAGCHYIYEDRGVSAVATRRPGYDAALSALRPHDTLVVWKLDRAWRSLKQAIDALEALQTMPVAFRSLTEPFDTATPLGQAMYQIQNVFAELERKLISERTKAGLAAARKRGKKLGRPPLLSAAAIARARKALTKGCALAELARQLRVTPRTLTRALRESSLNKKTQMDRAEVSSASVRGAAMPRHRRKTCAAPLRSQPKATRKSARKMQLPRR